MASVRVWIQSPKAAFKFTRDMVEFTSFWVEGKEEVRSHRKPFPFRVGLAAASSKNLQLWKHFRTFEDMCGSYSLMTSRIF